MSVFIDKLAEYSNISLPQNIIKEAEGLIALFLALRNVQDFSQFSSIVFLYVRSHYNESVSSIVIEYLSDLFAEKTLTEQSGFDVPNWLFVLRECQTSWSSIKSNRAFKHLSKFLGVLVTLGMCDASNLNFSIAGFKLFDSEVLKTHLEASDVIDALIGTVTFFAEGAYACFQTGSIKPLFLNDHSTIELDDEVILVTSWWDLVQNGNLEEFTGITENEFDRRLESVTGRLRDLNSAARGFDKKVISDKLQRLLHIRNEYVAKKINGGIREAPFGIEIYGKSNQGKTTVGSNIIDALCASAGLPTGNEYIATIKADDKFAPNWTSDKVVAKIDDFGNTKMQYCERAPTQLIIDLMNNELSYANKAEIASKGKCFYQPKLVVVTTNVLNLLADECSKCPYAVQRRMHIIIDVRVKKQFCKVVDGQNIGLDSKLVSDYYKANGLEPPLIEDLWEIDVLYCAEPQDLNFPGSYEFVHHNGKKMQNCSLLEVIEYCIIQFQEHRAAQAQMLKRQANRGAGICKCVVEGCPFLQGFCKVHPMQPHLGEAVAVAIERTRKRVVKRVSSDFSVFTTSLETVAVGVVYSAATSFFSYYDWMALVPESALDNEYFQMLAFWWYKDSLRASAKRIMIGLIVFPVFVFLVFGWLLALPCVLWSLYQYAFIASSVKRDLLDNLRKRGRVLPECARHMRDSYAKTICGSVLAIGALYAFVKAYKAWRDLKLEQGSLEPTSFAEVKKRDAEKNIWATVSQRALSVTERSKCIVTSELLNLVKKNLFYGSIDCGNRRMMVNGLFLKSNVVVIPNHYFVEGDVLKVTFFGKNPDAIGGKFDALIQRQNSYHIPNTDLNICYCANGGSFADLTDYLPLSNMGSVPFELVWRKKDGELIEAKGLGRGCSTTNTVADFDGGEYVNLDIDTFDGMCGAILVSQTKGVAIAGIHLGGIAKTPKGCYGLLTQSAALQGIEYIQKLEGNLITGSGGNFTPQILGVDILTNVPLHPKKAINYLPEGSQVQYYGTCTGDAMSTKSDVRVTPISEHLMDVCESPNSWGPPKMNPDWFGWQTCLANLSCPAREYPCDLLRIAVQDYKAPLIELINRTPEWRSMIPLTDAQTINGITGRKFIDAINMSTSIGYPLSGPKRNHVVELEPTEEFPCNRTFTPEIWAEIERSRELYAQGRRAYSIAKACKKDEVLPIAKEKCRIFYGNSIALTFFVRKYFLPIVRFMQMNPLLTECAVGINCHSPEWEEFAKHIERFGKERGFAGDYGKYDQRMPAQLIEASLRILIDLASACNYSEDDINMMRAIAGDIVFALIAYDGCLIGLTTGTHISGNSLTVILNGIGGSLNLRCGFYTFYPTQSFALRIPFRDAAAMMTYGDDNIGSVHPDYPEFNIKNLSIFLGEYGQIYTMPDKTSELVAYMNLDDAEFLKRQSVYHAALGQRVGALDEASLFKSLHCVLRPKKSPLTMEEACAQNIDGAIYEWFNHGPSVYEERRKQMKEVAQRAGIAHMCLRLNESYGEHAAEWHTNYSA